MAACRGVEERLAEARSTGRLNLSYLPPNALEEALAAAVAASSARGAAQLTELDLSSCGLHELPAHVATLAPSLQRLTLKNNRLASLPLDVLGRMRLQGLDLEGNCVAALGEGDLARLPALRQLNLSANGLAALPASIGDCRALEGLTAANNPMTALPDSLGDCPALTQLDVSGCRLLSLPASLARTRSLQRLFAQNNELCKVPTSLGHLRSLRELQLRGNRLPPKYEQARERGLAKLLQFLREEEEIEALAEIERNRPMGVTSGAITTFECKTMLADALQAAAKGQPTDGYAWARHGHASCQLDSRVYVFGGVVGRQGAKSGELLVLNQDSNVWRVQPTTGERTSPRDGHALAADPSGKVLWLFGGRKANGRLSAELFYLSVDSWTWHAPKTDAAAPAPAPREQCSAACTPRGCLLVFGGRTHGARLNCLWQFDPHASAWEQLPATGTAPSPRQGAAACTAADGQLWVQGGASNFTLHDTFVYSLEQHEWRAVAVEGDAAMAARGGGHTIAPAAGGGLWMFGGKDGMGAQAGGLLRLRPKAGGARWEWARTDVVLPPNPLLLAVFDEAGEQLAVMQCRHRPGASAGSGAEQGEALWDVTQIISLAHVTERDPAAEEALRACPKRERIAQASLTAAKLPRAFGSPAPREQQLLAAAATFRRAAAAPRRLVPAVSLLNECGAERVVCTTLRPARLPHIELYDLEGVAQFVGEWFNYEPLADPTRPPSHLVSPWTLLEWQAGDSFDLAGLACSLLLGVGYEAYVAVGYAPKQVALGDQSRDECPWLAEHGLEAPPYAELPALEPSFVEEAAAPAASAAATGADVPSVAAAVEADPAEAGGPSSSRPATGAAQQEPADPPAAADATEAEPAVESGAAAPSEPAAAVEQEQAAPAASGVRRPKRYVHAFVLIKPGRREVTRPLLLDPATGLLHPLDGSSGAPCPCEGIEWTYNAANFYVNQQCSASGGNGEGEGEGGDEASEAGPSDGMAAAHAVTFVSPELTDWSFGNPNCWSSLLADKEEGLMEAGTMASMLSGGTKASSSDLLLTRSGLLAAGRSGLSSLAPHASASQAAAFTPRSPHALCASPSAGSASLQPGSPGPGGVGLAQLAMGRHATPRLGGGHAPTCEPANSSMAYLSSPDDPSSLPPQHLRALAASPLHHSSLLPAQPEMPLSWVPPLVLARERLDTRCPWGAKTVQYRQARRELFALHGECSRWEGLGERLTTFADPHCTSALCVLELFQRRADRLERRQTWLQAGQRTVLSSFGPGGAACLKSLRTVTPAGGAEQAQQRARQGETELVFQPAGRLDGLMRRLHSGSELSEHYLPGARPDRLIHRTVLYSDAAGVGSGAACSAQERPVACIVERYSRAAEGDSSGGGGRASKEGAAAAALEPVVVERVCDYAAGRLQVVWQVPGAASPEGAEEPRPATTTTSRTYDLGGALLAGDDAAACAAEQRRREHAALWQAAQAAVVAVRAAESELGGILLARQREEQATRLLVPHYDAPREQVQESDGEGEGGRGGEDEAAYDLLANFLPCTGTRDMTAAEAEEARAACLAAFDERARMRVALLQCRLGESAVEMARLDGALGSEATLAPADQARLSQERSQAAFRLAGVQRRLSEHAPRMAAKRQELEARLGADRRLVAALTSGS